MNKGRKVKQSSNLKNEENNSQKDEPSKHKLLTPCRRPGLNRKRKSLLLSGSSTENSISLTNNSLSEIDIWEKEHNVSQNSTSTDKINLETPVIKKNKNPRKSSLGARKQLHNAKMNKDVISSPKQDINKLCIKDVSVVLTRCDSDKYINKTNVHEPSKDVSMRIENEAICSTPEPVETNNSEIQTNQISTTIEDATPTENNSINEKLAQDKTLNKSVTSKKMTDLFGDSDESDFQTNLKRKKRKRFSLKLSTKTDKINKKGILSKNEESNDDSTQNSLEGTDTDIPKNETKSTDDFNINVSQRKRKTNKLNKINISLDNKDTFENSSKTDKTNRKDVLSNNEDTNDESTQNSLKETDAEISKNKTKSTDDFDVNVSHRKRKSNKLNKINISLDNKDTLNNSTKTDKTNRKDVLSNNEDTNDESTQNSLDETDAEISKNKTKSTDDFDVNASHRKRKSNKSNKINISLDNKDTFNDSTKANKTNRKDVLLNNDDTNDDSTQNSLEETDVEISKDKTKSTDDFDVNTSHRKRKTNKSNKINISLDNKDTFNDSTKDNKTNRKDVLSNNEDTNDDSTQNSLKETDAEISKNETKSTDDFDVNASHRKRKTKKTNKINISLDNKDTFNDSTKENKTNRKDVLSNNEDSTQNSLEETDTEISKNETKLTDDFDVNVSHRKRKTKKFNKTIKATFNDSSEDIQKNKSKKKESSSTADMVKNIDSQIDSDEIPDLNISRKKRKRSTSRSKKSPKVNKKPRLYNSDSDDDFMEKPRREKKDPDIKKKINIPAPDPLNRIEHIRIRENKSYTIMHMNNISSYVKYYDNDVNLKRTESDDNQQTTSQPTISNVKTSMILERKDYLNNASQEINHNNENSDPLSDVEPTNTVSDSIENPEPTNVISNINSPELTNVISDNVENPESTNGISDSVENPEPINEVTESIENPESTNAISDTIENAEFTTTTSDNVENPDITTAIRDCLKNSESINTINFRTEIPESTDTINFRFENHESTNANFRIENNVFSDIDNSNSNDIENPDYRNTIEKPLPFRVDIEKLDDTQNEIRKMLDLKSNLLTQIKIKRDKLDSLRRISAYKEEHNLDELKRTTLQLKYTLQQALVDLLSHLKTHTERNFNMLLLLGFLKIPSDMVGYDEEMEGFE